MLKLITLTLRYLIVLGVMSGSAFAQVSPHRRGNIGLSVQGYSSAGVMTPNAYTLPPGAVGLSYDQQLPGAPDPGGHNIQMGFGLLSSLEMVGRIATNDLNCDMFELGRCPPHMIRDFSGSLKWKLPMPASWSNFPTIALGATDLGGAATYFRSYYGVASQQFGDVSVSLGMASARVPSAPLNGVFGSIYWQATPWLGVSSEVVGGKTWMSARLQTQSDFLSRSFQPYFSITQSMSDPTLTEKNWIGIGATMAFDTGLPSLGSSANDDALRDSSDRRTTVGVLFVTPMPPRRLASALQAAGFYRPTVRDAADGLWVRVNNTSYAWNLLDAAGSALGPVAAAYGNVVKPFILEVARRGIVLARLEGSSNCAYKFLTEGSLACSNGTPLRFVSLDNKTAVQDTVFGDAEKITSLKVFRDWWTDLFNAQAFRPELTLSPSLVTPIATEAGALDYDLAFNANLVTPLWQGAYLEVNRSVPSEIRSRDFQSRGTFYNSRLIAATDRKLFHQVLRIPAGDTLSRFSYGSIFARPEAHGESQSSSGAVVPITLPASDWRGWQVEVASQFFEGQLRLGVLHGDFNNEEAPQGVTGLSKKRSPFLASVRFAPGFSPSSDTELQGGTFWGGDKGFKVTQKFWHGDTSFGIFFRRSRIDNSEPYRSFAGFQISVPLTPRVNRSFDRFQLQGTNHFQYSAETKVLEEDNQIVQGLGIVPNVGESLSIFSNRDRLGINYLNTQIYRLRDGYIISR